MATPVETISIALPPDMTALVRAAVDSGEYASASEVVREALRVWTLKRKLEALDVDDLERLDHEGIDSGPDVDA